MSTKVEALGDVIDELDALLPRGWEVQPTVSMRWIIDHFPGASLAECWSIYDKVVALESRGAAIVGRKPPKRVTPSDGKAWAKFERLTADYHAAAPSAAA